MSSSSPRDQAPRDCEGYAPPPRAIELLDIARDALLERDANVRLESGATERLDIPGNERLVPARTRSSMPTKLRPKLVADGRASGLDRAADCSSRPPPRWSSTSPPRSSTLSQSPPRWSSTSPPHVVDVRLLTSSTYASLGRRSRLPTSSQSPPRLSRKSPQVVAVAASSGRRRHRLLGASSTYAS
ncbi:hypothetical protein K523DRAFT_419944 [Schizophyllum commune Tattone D]|nr:hypothetical protein K523DRAFT_419944 [Schizophyllum commune Tattone D]